MEFSEKIKIMVDEFGNGNNSQLARVLDINESKIRTYLNGSLPRVDVLRIFLDKLPINAEWLFYDNVDMLRDNIIDEEPPITIESIISDRVKEVIEPMMNNYKIMSLRLAQFELDEIKKNENIKSSHFQ